MRRKKEEKKFFHSYWFAVVVSCFLVASLIGTGYVFMATKEDPLVSAENRLAHSTSYSYKAVVKESQLFPDGGTITPGTVIFENVTTEIPLEINSILTSEDPVTFTGTYHPTLTIVADNYWSKEIPLTEEKSFELEGNSLHLFDKEIYSIDVNQVRSLITSIEEETGVRAENYSIKFSPNIQGSVLYNGMERKLDNNIHELQFNYSYYKFELSGNTEHSSEVVFEGDMISSHSLTILGLPISNSMIKGILVISVILFGVLLFTNLLNIRAYQQSCLSEVEKIQKKHGRRLIPVAKKTDLMNKSSLLLDSFDSLLLVADEKELPIFHYYDRNKSNNIYFIIDAYYLYSFEASDKSDYKKTLSLGSDLSYG
ncbi:DUF5305 family protein [Bacillus haimaensis]|uniref:DUF5305 family protein n=1 Tax=Bacillus haimaensis TaxID=3160967 RepID=UPI003AA93273